MSFFSEKVMILRNISGFLAMRLIFNRKEMSVTAMGCPSMLICPGYSNRPAQRQKLA